MVSAVSWQRLPGSKGVKFSLQGKDGQMQVTCLGPEVRWPGESLTVNTSAFPNAANVSLLSHMLETDLPPSILARYSSSAELKAGVLRRANDRGKPLPRFLEAALKTS